MYLGGACELGLLFAFCGSWELTLYSHCCIFAFSHFAFVSYAFVGKCFSHIQGMLECAIGKIMGKHVLVMGMIG